MPITYTQSQLRQCVGLTKEAFRHWRSVVGFLNEKGGRSAKFQPEHLLAASILREICEQTELGVGSLRGVTEEIFSVCKSTEWSRLENGWIIVEPKRKSSNLIYSLDLVPKENTVILCSLRPVVRGLQTTLAITQIYGSQELLPLSDKSLIAQSSQASN